MAFREPLGSPLARVRRAGLGRERYSWDGRSTSPPRGPRGLHGYAVVLLAAVLVCLAFDAYDVVRLLRGERFVLGSAEAARQGASRQTLS